MQTAAVGTKWFNTGSFRIAGLALALALIATVVAVTMWSTSGSESSFMPMVHDVSRLALDRDGADVFTPSRRYTTDTTRLALDRDGADAFAVPATSLAADVTGLNLDHDGADIFTTPDGTAPNTTRLHLDRDGADIP